MKNKKVCSKCGIEKPLSDFNKRKDTKDGYRYQCKECRKKYHIQYREDNKDKLSKQQKNWRINNIEKQKEYKKQYWIDNKKWKIEKNKQYYKKNKKNIISKQNKRNKKRIELDSTFRLRNRIKNSIYKSIKGKGYTKKSKTQEILGCPFWVFKQYIEMQFKFWMNWDNYGKYNGEFNYGWDLDHIIPLVSAKTEEEVIKLNHYTNFQPLCSKINRYIKRDKE